VTQKRILMLGPVDFSIDNAPKVHFSNLAKEFSELVFKVLCLVYSPRYKLIGSISENAVVKFAPNPLTGNSFSRTLKYLLLLPIILWNFFIFAPHIIYLRFSPPAFLHLLVLKLLKISPFSFKIILEFNSWVPEEREIEGESKFKVKMIGFLQIKSAFLSNYIRVVTPEIKERLTDYGIDAEKIAVIGNGTDINHFRPINKREAKEKIGLDPNLLYVGFIGNFSVWQGLDNLLISIPEVVRRKKNVRFILVGDGPEMKKIRKKVVDFKNKEVILTGRVKYELANNYINAFDVGVAPKQPNITIGYSPLKVRDYAACGVPIVTTKISGLEFVAEKGIGILVSPDNPKALSEAIIKLIENPALRSKLGRKGRKLAEDKFSWQNIAGQILNMVKD
jgi:glycosyltransferase involved in cell wall biosynthesis